MAILRWDPFREMTSLQSQVSRLADSMWSGRQESWLPAVDVFDTADAVVLKAELPGLKVDDIQIEVDDNVLTLKGERTFTETLDDGGGVYSSGNQCNGQVDAGTTCVESIALNPPDQCDDASYSGSITFSDDAGDTLGTVSLDGTATGDSSQCQTSPGDKTGAQHAAVPPHASATP